METHFTEDQGVVKWSSKVRNNNYKLSINPCHKMKTYLELIKFIFVFILQGKMISLCNLSTTGNMLIPGNKEFSYTNSLKNFSVEAMTFISCLN